METEVFIRDILLGEVRQMHQAGVNMHLLSAMAHGIEVCGALLDDKPFKAKGLGRSRFALALRRLFPKGYSEASLSVDLYGQLRSHMSHALLPGTLIRIGHGQHLKIDGKALQVCISDFFRDYQKAVGHLLLIWQNGQLPVKRIAG